MPKIRLIEPLSGWIKLEMETKLIDPPVVQVKVRPLTGLDTLDVFGDAGPHPKLSAVTLSQALAVIAEWDLVLDDKPLPCTQEVKDQYRDWLRLLLAQPLKPNPANKSIFAATEIELHAQDEETFLKN